MDMVDVVSYSYLLADFWLNPVALVQRSAAISSVVRQMNRVNSRCDSDGIIYVVLGIIITSIIHTQTSTART